ncbi:MAG: branched-chain amino acid transport system ATP-binding protein [Burkholderiales bacterium]
MLTRAPKLQLSDIAKRYGENQVLQGFSLDVPDGELLGVIGPNGAGKTTMFGIVSGLIVPDQGAVILDGVDITALAAYERCRAGIGRTFQVPRPFLGLTVFENVLVGARFGSGASGHAADEIALDALQSSGLIDRANQPAETLTLLQRKQLELARAVATQPRLLLLDEIAGGLTESETHRVVELVASLNARGMTIVWIEHLVHALASVASRLAVLNFGKLIAAGEPRSVLSDDMVRAVYLGMDVDEPSLHA